MFTVVKVDVTGNRGKVVLHAATVAELESADAKHKAIDRCQKEGLVKAGISNMLFPYPVTTELQDMTTNTAEELKNGPPPGGFCCDYEVTGTY